MRRVTVFEVAAEAGVSLATVDRVLNQRKGVRAATIDRVQAAIEKLNFRRDSFAAGLATGRLERYLFVLPARGTNSFINGLHDTVEASGTTAADQRVSIQIADYVALDERSLARTLATLDPQHWQGVAVVAIDAPPVRYEIDRLAAKSMPIVTLVSDVSPSRRSHFVGLDNKAAGRVAASLIGRMVPEATGPVGMIVGQMTLHDHADRRLGFEQVLRRDYPRLTLLPPIEGRDDSVVTGPLMADLLARHPDMVGLYSAGAGNRGIIAALRAASLPTPPIVVAHELTAHARDALLSDHFTVVLHQDQQQEVDIAIATLRAMTRADPDVAARPVRLQIFLRDNVP